MAAVGVATGVALGWEVIKMVMAEQERAKLENREMQMDDLMKGMRKLGVSQEALHETLKRLEDAEAAKKTEGLNDPSESPPDPSDE